MNRRIYIITKTNSKFFEHYKPTVEILPDNYNKIIFICSETFVKTFIKKHFKVYDTNTDKRLKVCCLCNKIYDNYGNNASPVKEGRCCDKCNIEKVVPARLYHL